jgi:hypothetical protein
MAQLKLCPKDNYLQYVVLQLARRENRLQEAVEEIDHITGIGPRRIASERAQSVDLFNMFSGALAIQESLQLDTMRDGVAAPSPTAPVPAKGAALADPKAAPAKQAPKSKDAVAIASLTGPTIKSHPWQKMLAGRKPILSPLARCVPEDFYYVEFRSLNKMLDALELGTDWTSHLSSQATQDAQTELVGERLKQQLAVQTKPLLRPFYNLVVEEAAVTGSDLYFREGSDVTLLFRFKQPAVFRARMNRFLDSAQNSRPEAKRAEGTVLGIPYVHVGTPDRAIHVFSAYPQENLHVRSNSLAGLTRVLEAVQGKTADGKQVRRLGDTDELAYVRTLMERGAAEEDGFIYLSDPFIRRLVGPQVKLTEARRMVCYNHLRMISNAALLYRSEHGKAPTSFAELRQAGCAPGEFGQGELRCPDGGTYTLAKDGMTAQCSHHGHCDCLVPCLEIPLAKVTADEAEQYRAFLEAYNQYWRTFFDPIAMRLQVTPKRLRLETIILPLIDNSIYASLAQALGGKPEALDALPTPKRNILSVAFRLNKAAMLAQAGLKPPDPSQAQVSDLGNRQACINNLKQIGIGLHSYHADLAKFPAVANFDKNNKPLLSWRVHILPYIEQQALYKEFHLDEPWDSAHNKKLIPRMPAIFSCPENRVQRGQTTYLAPVSKETVFTGDSKAQRLPDILDGTSNTVFVVDANDKHAVPWTKPEDLLYDDNNPWNGLVGHHGEACVALFVDGAVHVLNPKLNPERLAAFFTRAGGEEIALSSTDEIIEQVNGSLLLELLGPAARYLDKTRYLEFLTKGLGNQVGIHIYDAVPVFDFNLPGFLGMALGSSNGESRVMSDATIWIGMVGASLTSPLYVSLPVQDPKIVDEFLDQLDSIVARLVREQGRANVLAFRGDFCKTRTPKGLPARSFSVHVGPVTWRLFWARVNNGLYLTNKLFVLDDLADPDQQMVVKRDSGPVAHAMIRMRPQHWNQVLPDYRLGWADNDREACLNNVGPLSSMARSLVATMPAAADKDFEQAIHELAHRMYGVHFYCPQGGRYVVARDKKRVTCSEHGTALAPTQPAAEAGNRTTHRYLHEFAGMTVALTFLEDGLHAVVTIDRQ